MRRKQGFRFYLPPKPGGETDAEFWRRLRAMAAGRGCWEPLTVTRRPSHVKMEHDPQGAIGCSG